MAQFLYLAYALGHIDNEYVRHDAFSTLEELFNNTYEEVEHTDNDPNDGPDDD